MFNEIIWATDGSARAGDALEVARELALATGARLLAAHCREFTVGREGADGYPVLYNEEEVQAAVSRTVAELRDAGLDARARFLDVHPGRVPFALADLARDSGSSLIVVASRGHGPAVGLLLGNVTERLLRVAPCPVVVVPASARTQPARSRSGGAAAATAEKP